MEEGEAVGVRSSPRATGSRLVRDASMGGDSGAGLAWFKSVAGDVIVVGLLMERIPFCYDERLRHLFLIATAVSNHEASCVGHLFLHNTEYTEAIVGSNLGEF